MPETDSLPYDHAQDLQLEIERPLPDWGGDDVFATSPRQRFARAERPASVSVGATEPERVLSWERPPERRTVVITGRPFDHPRRRPARTVDDHIAQRPARLAAWAVALGFGLVVAAIATAPL